MRCGADLQQEESDGLNVPASVFLEKLRTQASKFAGFWELRDEEWNFAQKHDPEIIKDLLRPAVREEIRVKEVDVVMMEELENLKAQLEKGEGVAPWLKAEGKRGKRRSRRRRRGRRTKRRGRRWGWRWRADRAEEGPNGEQNDSLTADGTCGEEFVEIGSSRCVSSHLQPGKDGVKGFIGDFKPISSTMAKAGAQQDCSLNQIRNVSSVCSLSPSSPSLKHASSRWGRRRCSKRRRTTTRSFSAA